MRKTLSILCCFMLININCTAQQTNQQLFGNKINSYIEVYIQVPQETINIGQKMKINITFKNITNKYFYFHPNALISIEREINGIFSSDINFKNINFYENINYLYLFDPFGVYSITYEVIVEKPWCAIGINELYIVYYCKRLKEQTENYNILYGKLKSNSVKIVVTDIK